MEDEEEDEGGRDRRGIRGALLSERLGAENEWALEVLLSSSGAELGLAQRLGQSGGDGLGVDSVSV